MNQKRYLIKGTLLLTVMGLLTRAVGFFYKIFLSRTIGASEIGLYQIAVPILSLCTALCGGGIQTALSGLVARSLARRSRHGAKQALFAGLFLSLSLSMVLSVTLYFGAELLAERILLEKSCAGLLKVLAFSLPFGMIHSCICGYFMGAKQIVPPALAQFAEQVIRISFFILAFTLFRKNGIPADARLMACSALAGEAASALFCVLSFFLLSEKKAHKENPDSGQGNHSAKNRCFSMCKKWLSFRHGLLASIRQILSVSVPLSLNRMLMCLLQTVEAALLPQMLRRSGLTPAEALSSYGTLTGMALPMILFPTAVTSALGMLLLPTVSEVQALHQKDQLSSTANAAFLGGLLLGSFCLGGFLLFGGAIGSLLFHNRLAGSCIRRLALICPLLYISTTLTSILHGLGKSASLLLWNLAGFVLRLLCVICLVPTYGLYGYLCGMILDQLLLTVCILYSLHRQNLLTVSIPRALTQMLPPAVLAGSIAFLFLTLSEQKIPAQISLITGGAIYGAIFILSAAPALSLKYKPHRIL